MDPHRYRSLTFEPLKEEDIPILYSWLQKTHVREFTTASSVNGIVREYLQRLDPDWPTKCFLSYAGLVPIGYVQVYRVVTILNCRDDSRGQR